MIIDPKAFTRYLKMAYVAAESSHCVRAKVGALIVRDDNVLAFGYNGTPRGFDNCCEIGDVTNPEVLHAESNAIAKIARSTNTSEGATLYCTLEPCFDCAKLIIQAGIKQVIYSEAYRCHRGIELLHKAKVYAFHFPVKS
jgi:dCMP deaminase